MTNGELDTTLAVKIIDDTPNKYVDWLDFGGAYIAVAFHEDVGVVLYSNGVDWSKAYHGNASFVARHAEQWAQEGARVNKNHDAFDEIENDPSHEPLFEVDHDERTITTTEAYEL